MSSRVLFDEIHLSLLVSPRVLDQQCLAMRRALDSPRFQSQLRLAVLRTLRRNAVLRRLGLKLSW
jgi:hypothetical protein